MIKLTKIEWGLGISYILLAFIDLASTLIINPNLINHLETNPLFILNKSFWPIILINLGLVCYLIYLYRKEEIGTRFFVISFVVYLTAVRILTIIGNIQVYLNPPTLVQAAKMTTSIKTTYLFSYVLNYLFIPIILNQITYFLFSLDHKIKRKK